MEANPHTCSSELGTKVSTCIVTMAQKPLATAVLNRKVDGYSRFLVCQTWHLKSTHLWYQESPVLFSYSLGKCWSVSCVHPGRLDPPTARQLVGSMGHIKADLTHQFVWWCIRKRAVIPLSLRRTSHRSQQHETQQLKVHADVVEEYLFTEQAAGRVVGPLAPENVPFVQEPRWRT